MKNFFNVCQLLIATCLLSACVVQQPYPVVVPAHTTVVATPVPHVYRSVTVVSPAYQRTVIIG